MKTVLRGMAILGGLFLSLFHGPEAHAESAPAPPSCRAAIVPTSGEAVPANIPALVAWPTGTSLQVAFTYSGSMGSSWGGSFTAQTDARYPGATLLVPSEALPTGAKVDARFALTCDSIDMTGQTATDFEVTTAAPLPTTIGTVTASASQDDLGFEITPSAELVRFLPVVMLEMRSRGRTHALTRYGMTRLDANGRIHLGWSRSSNAFGWCAQGETSDKTEPVELIAHVAGATEDPPPVSADARVTCTYRDGSSSPQGPTDAGPDTETTVRDDAGGCAAVPNAPASIWSTSAVGALIVVVLRRKRR